MKEILSDDLSFHHTKINFYKSKTRLKQRITFKNEIYFICKMGLFKNRR